MGKYVTVIIILLILALSSGYYIYSQKVVKKLPSSTTSSTTSSIPTLPDKPFFKSLSDNEKQLAALLLEHKQGNLKGHFDLISNAAKKSGTLELNNGCYGTPLVLDISQNPTIIIKNADKVDHLIAFGKATEITIPANESKSFTHGFTATDIYQYICDGNNFPGGIFIIKQQPFTPPNPATSSGTPSNPLKP